MRKTTHLCAFIIPGGYYFFELYRSTFLIIMAFFVLVSLYIDLSRLRNWRFWHVSKRIIAPFLRESEINRGDFSGATYILTAAWITAALFPKPIVFAALCFIIFGDPISAFIGGMYGKHKFKNKSFEGSLAFLVAASVVALLAPDLPLSVAFTGAVVATITEAVSFKVDDNITVPLVSGLVMILLMKIFF